MKIDPKRHHFGKNFHKILTGVIVPRPIAFVSTISIDGVMNLAPYSFFNAMSSSPATVVFGSSRHADWKEKDTLSNIESTGEFVVNVVVDEIAEAMSRTAVEYPSNVNEFDIAGLTPVASDLIRSPRVAESPVNLECKLNQVIPIGSGETESGIVIGEVILMHIRDDIINGHRIDHEKLRPTGRLAGSMYCHTFDVFEMIPPTYNPAG